MSLRIAFNSANTGIRTTQTAIGVSSQNITNAQSPDYSRKVVHREPATAAGSGAGVRVSGIESARDRGLVSARIEAAAQAGYADARGTGLDRLQNRLGSPGSGEAMTTGFGDFAAALQALATTPQGSVEKAGVVDAAEQLAADTRRRSDDIQQARGDADRQLDEAMAGANHNLEEIARLNRRISHDKAAGIPTGDLEDSRLRELDQLSRRMDVQYFVNDSGELRVYTAAGRTLVDSTGARQLSFDRAGSVSASSSRAAGTLSGVRLAGQDISDEIGSGEIGGLLSLRDADLPAEQDRLDALAGQFRDEMNRVHNQGTAWPAPQSLSGSQSRSSADAISGAGHTTIAVVDADGRAVETRTLDLSTLATVDDVVQAIDGMANVSAALDGSGRLIVTADDPANGVAIGDGGGTIDGAGLSSYFGLNDLFTGQSGADLAVRADIAAEPGRLASGRASADAATAAGDVVTTAGDGRTADALARAMSESRDFSAGSGAAAARTSFSGRGADLAGVSALTAAGAADQAAEEQAMYDRLRQAEASVSGVNIDEETATLTMLEESFQASAAIIRAVREMADALMEAVS